MRAIARRDRAALEAFYDRHASVVMGLCTRVLGDPVEAEEVVSDVFFEVWDRSDRYDAERGTPMAYLMNLSRSRAIDRLRRVRRHGGPLIEVTEERLKSPEPYAPSPLLEAVRAERRDQVRAALEALGPRQRRAVELSFFRGLTHPEIAELLDEPIGTVKTWIRRSLIRLRNEFGDGGDEL